MMMRGGGRRHRRARHCSHPGPDGLVCMYVGGWFLFHVLHPPSRAAARRLLRFFFFFGLRRLTEPPSERAEVARLGWFVGRDVRGRAVLARVVMDGMTRHGDKAEESDSRKGDDSGASKAGGGKGRGNTVADIKRSAGNSLANYAAMLSPRNAIERGARR